MSLSATDVAACASRSSRGAAPLDAVRSDRAVELCFFLDADIALLLFEMYADDLPLERAQDTLFRFGRAYPALLGEQGEGGNCPSRGVARCRRRGAGRVRLRERARYISRSSRAIARRVSRALGIPAAAAELSTRAQTAPLRYRQLEYYRMPLMAYLALDDPHELTRARLRAPRPGHAPPAAPTTCRTPAATLRDFERALLHRPLLGTAAAATPRAIPASSSLRLAMISSAVTATSFFSGSETGLLGAVSRSVLPAVPDRALPQGGPAVDVRRTRRGDESPRRWREPDSVQALQAHDPPDDGSVPALHPSLLVPSRFPIRALARELFARLSRQLSNDEL